MFAAMVHGPMAAFLVEMFPTKIRSTSMAISHHVGNPWIGGVLPLVSTMLVMNSGNIYHGLWYPVAISALTVIVGVTFLRKVWREARSRSQSV
jgi:hypothetical protein